MTLTHLLCTLVFNIAADSAILHEQRLVDNVLAVPRSVESILFSFHVKYISEAAACQEMDG
jgi:hypothetical protein